MYDEDFSSRIKYIREVLSRADGSELLYIYDMIGTELRARNERLISMQAKINVLEESRCVMAFLCDHRITPTEFTDDQKSTPAQT